MQENDVVTIGVKTGMMMLAGSRCFTLFKPYTCVFGTRCLKKGMVVTMRKDGRYLRDTNPMYKVACHIMDKRYDAMNMVEVDIPIDPMRAYIGEKRKEGKAVSHLALLIAAYLRTAAEYPEINRFIVNKRVYARNEFAVGMVVLKPGRTDGTMNKMYFDFEDDIFTVQRKIDDYVSQNRQEGETNGTDRIVNILLSIPGLLRFGVNALKFLDKFGLLPKAVIDMSPFHTSLVITNLASIRSKHIYHHCYEFGTTSIIIAMGSPIEVPVKKAGGIEFEHMMPLGIVMDERIASGSYFTMCMHKIEAYLKDPKQLEGPPKVVIREYLKPSTKKKTEKNED